MYFVYVFFVFKQKTAYELRISDWSSDVCSSDLRPAPAASVPVRRENFHSGLPHSLHRDCRRRQGSACGHPLVRCCSAPARLKWRYCSAPVRPSIDRKSVVSGKGVSVRVDLGGRLYIQKKKHEKIIHKKKT